MKKVLFFTLFALFWSANSVFSQVTIGSDAEPSQWSLLDLKTAADGTSTKGFHLPRMTAAQRDALSAQDATNGLIIYNTTTKCIEYWNLIKP